jgi:hypothetical protein
MTGEPDWVPAGVDTKRANVARVYDYLLGGTHNFLADQDVGRTAIAVEPTAREHMRANRAFLGRAVRYLASIGVRQFLDIGSGIPAEGNVHEIAQATAPGSHVVYVDSDAIAVAHSRMMLSGNEDADVIEADLRSPEEILAHETTRRLIDVSQPVGLILCMVLHFIPDSGDPANVVARLMAPMASGSFAVISHITDDGSPMTASALEKVYNRNIPQTGYFRSGTDIRRLFGDLELIDPGLVVAPYWRPDPPGPPSGSDKIWGVLSGVARKP